MDVVMSSQLEGPPFTCSVCQSVFGNTRDIKRHLLRHTDYRPFQCNFCSQSFKRRDTLNRHWKVCTDRVNSGAEIPHLPKHKAGRKKISCDQCTRLKKACTRTAPCRACVQRNQPCSLVELYSSTSSSKHDSSDSSSSRETAPYHNFTSRSDVAFSRTSSSQSRQSILTSGAQSDRSSSTRCSDSSLIPSPHVTSPPAISSNAKSIILEQLGGPANPKLRWIATFVGSRRGIAEAFSYSPTTNRSTVANVNVLDTFQQATTQTSGQRMLNLIKNWEDSYLDNAVGKQPGIAEWGLQTTDHLTSIPSTLDGQLWVTNALEKKSAEIIECIQRATELKQPNSNVTFRWLCRYEALCRLFFSSNMILYFLDSYWAHWYGHFSYVHRPTFDPTSAHTPLVAAMVLIGAAHCKEENYRNAAATFFDAVEEWLFQHEDFTEVPLEAEGSEYNFDDVVRRMNALRAAHTMTLLQTYEGSETAQTRVIYQRYAQLVAVARSLCNACNTHGSLKDYLNKSNPIEAWKRFTLVEDIIRTVKYAYLTDWCHCLFRNTMPLVRLEDLFIDLACPDVCYEAPTLEHWQNTMAVWAESDIGKRQMSYADAMLIMCEKTVSPEDATVLCQMSSLNLATLIFGFNAMLSHLRAAQGFVKPSEAIQYALENWGKVWSFRKPWPGLEEDMSKPTIRFVHSCQEFYCMAYVLLRKLSKPQRAPPGRSQRNAHSDDNIDILSLITDFSTVMLELDSKDV